MPEAGGFSTLLFAALAVERGLVSAKALTLAVEGTLELGTTLADQLVADGALTNEQRDQLEREVLRAQPPSGDDDVPLEHPRRYELGERTGRGGQAVVMVAFDRFIGREVALKIMTPDGERATESSVSTGRRSTSTDVRFLREARVTGQLEHPNIVPVHEVGRRADGTLYYAMRLVRGRTLAKALEACRTLKERLKLLNAFHDVCNAIAFAHSRDVVHRDIKPANVMVGEFGETVVLDWGIAKVRGAKDLGASDLERRLEGLQRAGDDTRTGLVGTPSYMSPEQARGDVDAIDQRSDVWSLGVVLYELLAGRRPFSSSREADTLERIATEEPPPIRSLEPAAPRELVAIAEKALQKKPDDRYPSAREFAEEIGAYLTGEKVGAYDYSSLELLKRFAAKNKAALVAAAAVAGAVVLSLVAVTASLKHETKALANEREARLVASFHLAQAYDEKAARAGDEGRHLADELLSAASLAANPAHPGSDFFDASFASAHPEARQLRVDAASRLFRTEFELNASLEQRFPARAAIRALAWSHDGRALAYLTAGGDDVHRQRLDGSAATVVTHHEAAVDSLATSPDDRLLASGDEHGELVVSGPGGDARWKLDGGTLYGLVFVGATRVAAVSDDGALRLVTLADGSVATLPLGCGSLTAVAASPDGTRVAAGCHDGHLVVVDPSKPEILRTLSAHADGINVLAYSSDGRRLASGGLDHLVKIWDATTGAWRATLTGHEEGVVSLAFSPDGARLASGSNDKTAKVWDLATGAVLDTLGGHGSFVSGVAWSPGGTRLATASYDRSIRVWRLGVERPTTTFAGHTGAVYSARFSPDGRLLATAGWDRTVRVWDVATGRTLRTLRAFGGFVDAAVFTPDGARLVTSSRDHALRVWDVATGKLVDSAPLDARFAWALAISPDGRRLAAGLPDGRVRELDLKTLSTLDERRGHTATVFKLAYSPDGRWLASSSWDDTVRLWPTAGGEPKVLRAHTDWASGVAFSPDSTRVATSGKDGRVLVWDVATGTIVARLVGHRQWVNDVRFSPDGTLLATASDDHTARLWDARTGAPRLIIRAAQEVAAIDFSPDGRRLAVGDAEVVRLYPVDFSTLDTGATDAVTRLERASGLVLDGFELDVAPGASTSR